MEFKTKQQSLAKQSDEISNGREKLERDLQDQTDKINRAQKTFQSKLNNVKSVKGQGFENSKENVEILVQMEQEKNK